MGNEFYAMGFATILFWEAYIKPLFHDSCGEFVMLEIIDIML